MEQRVEVDWEKWNKREWPKMPLLIAPALALLGLSAGLLVNRVLPAAILGVIAGYCGAVFTRRALSRRK